MLVFGEAGLGGAYRELLLAMRSFAIGMSKGWRSETKRSFIQITRAPLDNQLGKR